MSEHTDTDYHHDAATAYQADPPATIKPTLKLSEPTPRPSRAWPLAARLAVAVLIIGLATISAMSLMSIHTVTARANQASQQAAADQSSLAAMGRQLTAVQAEVAAPAQGYRPPALHPASWGCGSVARHSRDPDPASANPEPPLVVSV